MNRLTQRTPGGVAYLAYPETCYFSNGEKCQIAMSAFRQLAIERLAEYEDLLCRKEEENNIEKQENNYGH